MKKILYLFLALASYGISAQTTAEEYLNSAVSKFYLDDMKGAIVDYTKAIKLILIMLRLIAREVLLKKH